MVLLRLEIHTQLFLNNKNKNPLVILNGSNNIQIPVAEF
jgi:hypothetical protein